MHDAKQGALRTISSLLYRQQVGVFVNNYGLKVTNPSNLQSEFTALQGAIHGLANLKQKLEQTKIFKLNNYIIKMAY